MRYVSIFACQNTCLKDLHFGETHLSALSDRSAAGLRESADDQDDLRRKEGGNERQTERAATQENHRPPIIAANATRSLNGFLARGLFGTPSTQEAQTQRRSGETSGQTHSSTRAFPRGNSASEAAHAGSRGYPARPNATLVWRVSSQRSRLPLQT